MEEKTSVAVDIAGRTFPVSVDSKEREIVLQAQELIATTYKKYKTQFVSLERSDILSMVVLELVTEQLRKENKDREESEKTASAVDQLSQLSEVLDSYLHSGR